MKKRLVPILLFCTCSAFAQIHINYDESKIPNYVLPELLKSNDGTPITSVEQWEKIRKPELMEYFSSLEYGRTPTDKIDVSYETLAENPKAFDGKATTKQVLFKFTNGKKVVEALLLLVTPNQVKGKVPVIVSYNFRGNHSTTTDTTILYSPAFLSMRDINHPMSKRGNQVSRWCYDKIIDRGYAVATMWYQDIYPDKVGLEDKSVASLFPGYEANANSSDKWQAIGVWSWGSSRIVDYLETQDRIDKDKIAVTGHSRQGKSALWTGAQDPRFKVVISNDSGCGGAALFKRVYGENIAKITELFPHWFCPAFSEYAHREADLPFDQHQLMALIAPRHVYVASAAEDLWADPKGEFLSVYHAAPVYKLYGMEGFESDKFPEIHEPVMTATGYHVRAGDHDVKDYDWERYMDFCDKWF